MPFTIAASRPPEQEGIRLLGVALHLDFHSERIARLPETLKSRARQEFAKNKPFDPKREKGGAT